jgi:hypothetical protein
MSYLSQSALAADVDFCNRSRAVLVEQSFVYKDDTRPDMVALAESILRWPGPTTATFYGTLAASPGFAATVDNGDGTIDSAKVADPDLLGAVQSQYPAVAALYYAPDGTPLT